MLGRQVQHAACVGRQGSMRGRCVAGARGPMLNSPPQTAMTSRMKQTKKKIMNRKKEKGRRKKRNNRKKGPTSSRDVPRGPAKPGVVREARRLVARAFAAASAASAAAFLVLALDGDDVGAVRLGVAVAQQVGTEDVAGALVVALVVAGGDAPN